jgi:hypothetical protein
MNKPWINSMPDAPSPTPYPDVNAVLHAFTTQAQAILGAHFVGLYLSGSLAVGDFEPRSSAIDFVVVTDGQLPADRVAALREMHARFAAGESPWAERIEAVYIPQAALRDGAPPAARYPVLEKGDTLALAPLEDGWPVQLYTLREHGVAVAGPDPRSLISPVPPAAMNRAGYGIAAQWLDQARTDPSWLDWLRPRQHQAFVVLTLCRLLYTLETGGVISKPGAAWWGQQHLGPRWAGLIAQAVAGQHAAGDATDHDIAETVALVAHTVERFRQGATPPRSQRQQRS